AFATAIAARPAASGRCGPGVPRIGGTAPRAAVPVARLQPAARWGVRGLRCAASAAGPWPDVAGLPAPAGFQAAVPPRAGQLAAVVQRSVGPDAAAVRRCGAPDVAPSPVAAAWPVDGTPARRGAPWLAAGRGAPWLAARRDAPWLAAPPDGPL